MIRKLLIAALALIPSFGAIAQTEIAKGDVNLMVVSDLGRNGHYDQKPVAATMGRIAKQNRTRCYSCSWRHTSLRRSGECDRSLVDDQL